MTQLNNTWYDLTPFWELIGAIAQDRNSQKGGFASSQYWNKDPHFVGLCGEFIFDFATNLPIDLKLKVKGDGGTDFKLADGRIVNVKTSTYWNDPHLKMSEKDHWVDIFVLAGLDYDRQRCKLFGWATADELRNGQIANYGYGDRYTLRPKDLHKEQLA